MSSITSLASGLTAVEQAALRSEISFTLAAKQLAAQEQQGQAALELLDTAAQLAKEAGKGQQIDSLA